MALAASCEFRHLNGQTPGDAPTAHLWRTWFALVVELSIRSGLVTEHDLVPVGPVNPSNEEVSNAAECEALQEQGEESADEHDPIVEFAPEPDELRNSQDGLSLAQLSNATTSQVTATAPSAVSPDHIEAPLRPMALGRVSPSGSNIQ